MNTKKETLQNLQNIIDLAEQKKKLEQEAITLKKQEDEASDLIAKEDGDYQQRLEIAKQHYENKVSASKNEAQQLCLRKLSSQIPQLPLSSVQTNAIVEAKLDQIVPTDSFLQETKGRLEKMPSHFLNWDVGTFLWILGSLLACGGITVWALAANFTKIQELAEDTPAMLWIGYIVCSLSLIIWFFVIVIVFIKDANWSLLTSPKLSEDTKKKLQAMKVEEKYER
jgi:predicted outer membrane lipoprotein